MNTKDDVRILTNRDLTDQEINEKIDAFVRECGEFDVASGYSTLPQYTVSDLAEILETPKYNIRFWDKEHLFPFVTRKGSNERMFSSADMAYGKMISCLRRLGLSIHDCRLFILDTMEGDETLKERLYMLLALQREVEEQISELQTILLDLQYKVRFYSHLEENAASEMKDGTFEDKKRGTMYDLHQFVLKQKGMMKLLDNPSESITIPDDDPLLR